MAAIPTKGWRIYRLPGSRDWWLIDHGPGSAILYAKSLNLKGVDVVTEGNPTAVPRAWLYTEAILYLHKDTATFFKAAA